MADKAGGFTEAQVISRLREIFATSDPRVEIGIGDDAAVVAGTDKRQVMTTDMAVEGVHFRTDWSTAFEIGRKATAANAADILAMGATPDYLLVAVALTGSENIEWINPCFSDTFCYEYVFPIEMIVDGQVWSVNSNEHVDYKLSIGGELIYPLDIRIDNEIFTVWQGILEGAYGDRCN